MGLGTQATQALGSAAVGLGSQLLLRSFDFVTLQRLAGFSFQSKNKFSFQIIRTPKLDGGVLKGITSTAGAVADTLITSLLVQKIDVPPELTFATSRANGNLYIRSLERTDEVTITFLERTDGMMIRYFQEWMDNICFPDPKRQGEYIFRDDQEFAKRTGILLLETNSKSLGSFPRITFYGLRYKTRSLVQVGQDETENLIWSAQFSVDDVAIPTIF